MPGVSAPPAASKVREASSTSRSRLASASDAARLPASERTASDLGAHPEGVGPERQRETASRGGDERPASAHRAHPHREVGLKGTAPPFAVSVSSPAPQPRTAQAVTRSERRTRA